MSQQPEALRLADSLELMLNEWPSAMQAAAELRRLYSLNAELLDALKLIAASDTGYKLAASAMQDIARIAISKAEGQP